MGGDRIGPTVAALHRLQHLALHTARLLLSTIDGMFD